MKTSRTSDVQFILFFFFFFFNWMSSKIYNDIMKIFHFFFPKGAEGVIDVERCFVCARSAYARRGKV